MADAPPGTPPSATVVARAVADALQRAGVPYAIGGAIALGLHAPPRATNDVDVTAFVGVDGLGPVMDALERDGGRIDDRAGALASAAERGDFRVDWGGLRVDVFVPSIPFYRLVAERVRSASLGGRPIQVLSPEDLAVFKLLFFRGKDLVDLERLVAFQGAALDAAYVRDALVDIVGASDARVARWDEIVRAYGSV
jgi:hypothetical protein